MLILQDGVRVPPTAFTGDVDISIIPTLLVQRVDVVTGGASAAYGSDAVSGVVNFVLDHRLNGVKGVVQRSITELGDAANYRVGIAGGFNLGSRLHVAFSGERYENEGMSVVRTFGTTRVVD